MQSGEKGKGFRMKGIMKKVVSVVLTIALVITGISYKPGTVVKAATTYDKDNYTIEITNGSYTTFEDSETTGTVTYNNYIRYGASIADKWGEDSGREADKAIDNDSSTRWAAQNSGDDGFITVDGEVCYKLRCAYLHSGNFNLGDNGVVKHIGKFTFHYNRNPDLRFIQVAQSTGGKYLMDIDLGVFCWQLCTAATSFYKNHQQECSSATIEIKDTTPTEEEQKALRALVEEKSGYTFEEMKEMKRKDSTFEIDIDFLT